MKQFSQKVANKLRQNLSLSFALISVSISLLVIIIETIRLDNTGFNSKTLWDWMDLLLVPALLSFGIWWLNKAERENDKIIAAKQRQNEAQISFEKNQQSMIKEYFDLMTRFLLEKDIRNAAPESELRTLARAQTLNIFRTLDNKRKWQVVLFLYELDLISKNVVIDLQGANLSKTDSGNSSVLGASLENINLKGAILNSAILMGLDFSFANLEEALFVTSTLTGCKLYRANLRRTVLMSTDLRASDLRFADLRDSALIGTDLRSADLRGADLRGAHLKKAIFRDGDIDEEEKALISRRQNALRERYGEGEHRKEVIEIDEHVMLGQQNRNDTSFDLRGARYDNKTSWPADFDPISEGAIILVIEDYYTDSLQLLLKKIKFGECYINPIFFNPRIN